MDEEPKPIQESSFVEEYLPRQEVASSFLFTRKTNPNPIKELESTLKSRECLAIQTTHLLKGMESPNLARDGDGGIPFHGLDENPVSSLLDLTSNIAP